MFKVSQDDFVLTLGVDLKIISKNDITEVWVVDVNITSVLSDDDWVQLYAILNDNDHLKNGGECDLETIVNIEGYYRPGSKDYFDNQFGNWLPGDNEDIKDIRVKIGDIDITHTLSVDDVIDIEQKLCELGREHEPDVARD